MFSLISRSFAQYFIILIALFFHQGCAVLTQSQIDAVGDFSTAAENYNDLPGSVVNMHAESMLTENIFAIATLTPEQVNNNDPNTQITRKINNNTDAYLQLLKEADKADAALNVIGSYVRLLSKLTSGDFTEQLQQEAALLGVEIDGGINQFNAANGSNIDGFGAAVAAIVRAGGGIIIRYKQAEALKEAVNNAEPVIAKISNAVTNLMGSYIGIVDNNGTQLPGYGQLTSEGLLNEYKGLLDSNKSNNSTQDVQNIIQLLIRAKSIQPLAEKTKQAMISFQAAHTQLYEKLQERQTLEGSIEEIKVLFAEVKAAQQLKQEIEQ